ncbi:hypothetical protein B0H13DRAFT_2454613 [Mycena leptocephala]|nr:hypothetical protein B0H13DRAFT_2454613 [Mycena leptocephala]
MDPVPNFNLDDPRLYFLDDYDYEPGIAPQDTLLRATSHVNPAPHLIPSPSNLLPVSTAGNPQALIDCSSFIPGLSVSGALRLAGITADEEKRAKPDGSRVLWDMTRNHSRAVAILDRFGLSAEKTASLVLFKGGLKLTTAQVVSHLGWTTRTFTRKSATYRQARALATYSWKGQPPAQTADDTVRDLYRVWQGVVEMFRVGGFVDQPRAPRDDNLATEAEKRAAQLSQNDLYSELKKIFSNTEPST